MKSIMAVLLVCTGLISCGGGGGSNTLGGNPTEAERAQAFLDEAIRLAEVNAVVTCDMVVCSIVDDESESERFDGVVVHGCQWNCLESRIDDSGETRNYLIFLLWERLPDGCFGPAEVFLQQEILALCVPNQERF